MLFAHFDMPDTETELSYQTTDPLISGQPALTPEPQPALESCTDDVFLRVKGLRKAPSRMKLFG